MIEPSQCWSMSPGAPSVKGGPEQSPGSPHDLNRSAGQAVAPWSTILNKSCRDPLKAAEPVEVYVPKAKEKERRRSLRYRSLDVRDEDEHPYAEEEAGS